MINYLAGQGNELISRHAKSGDGLHTFTICQECNQMTGAWYVPDYGDFIEKIGSRFIYDCAGNRVIYLRSIHPVRILKEIYCMFLCALTYEPPPSFDDLRKFVHEKDSRLPPDAPEVYLYWNASECGRLVPLQMMAHMWQTRNKHVQLSEISWPPLGIVISYNYDDRLEHMEKITSWSRFLYSDTENLTICLPGRTIADPSPLAFGDPWTAEREKNSRGTVNFLHVKKDNSVLGMGLTWKPKKR
jgi:hypothetical protein